MAVKDIIKNRRIELGLTMKEVADAVGVSEGTISRWESGHIANMRRDKIVALAKVLGLSPSVIMEWDGNKMISIPAVAEAAGIDDGTREFVDKIMEKQRNQRIAESVNKNYAENSTSSAVYYTNPETARIAQEMFDDPEMRSLFHMKRNMDPKKFQAHYDMMKQLYALEHPEDADDFEGC